MAASKKWAPSPCNCIDMANKALEKAKGARFIQSISIPDGSARAVLATEWTGLTRRHPPLISPEFCPFCGVKYPERGVWPAPAPPRARAKKAGRKR